MRLMSDPVCQKERFRVAENAAILIGGFDRDRGSLQSKGSRSRAPALERTPRRLCLDFRKTNQNSRNTMRPGISRTNRVAYGAMS